LLRPKPSLPEEILIEYPVKLFSARHQPTAVGHGVGPAPDSGLVPVQVPAWQESVGVQALPSLQVKPSAWVGFEHKPVPGGLSSREATQLLRGLAGINLVGMDLVEVCPALDHADITLHLGAHLLFEGLALLAVKKPRARRG